MKLTQEGSLNNFILTRFPVPDDEVIYYTVQANRVHLKAQVTFLVGGNSGGPGAPPLMLCHFTAAIARA